MNLPNALTLSRIFLVPLLVVVLLSTQLPYHDWIGVSLFLLAALTDTLDGYFARRRGQITSLGMLLDPIADKLLISAALISLVKTVPWVPAWMVVIIIGREFIVSGLRSIASAEGFTIDASELGKAKMVMQVIAVTLIILGNKISTFRHLGEISLYLVGFFAVISAVQYFRKFWGKVDSSIKERQRRRLSRLAGLRRRQKRDDVPAQ